MVNDSPLGALSHWWPVYGSKKKKKKMDGQNLTIMTLDLQPCQLVPMWFVDKLGVFHANQISMFLDQHLN